MIKRLIDDIKDQDVRLVAVSKTKPIEAILELYNMGHRDFGENRVQELCDKKEKLPQDIRWHLIGHLQKNKVKYIADFVHLIQSVDSLKLAEKINKEAVKHNRIIPVLLQLKLGSEESKSGIEFDTLKDQIAAFIKLDHISIQGLMGIGTLTQNRVETRKEFAFLKACFDELKQSYFVDDDDFSELSMGMSGDYTDAIELGSTMVRIGSLLFGSRN